MALSDRGGQVEIVGELDGEWLRVRVCDSGRDADEAELAVPQLSDADGGEQGTRRRPGRQRPRPSVQRKSLDALETKFGEGASLGRREAGLARSVGADPAALRVHTGPVAAQVTAEHDAVAFAAGRNVVMGGAAPAVGPPEGDALLRHEASRVAQQQDAARDPAQHAQPISEQQQAAEGSADQSAAHAPFGPHLTPSLKQKYKQSVAAAIAERFPSGFEAAIPDGNGGLRTITVVPLAS